MRKLRNQGSLGCARSCFSYNNETPFNSSCMSKYITNAILRPKFPLSWNADFNILRRERYFSTGSLSSQYELFVLLLCSRIKAFYMNNSDSAACPLISVLQCSFHYCLFFVFSLMRSLDFSHKNAIFTQLQLQKETWRRTSNQFK